MANDDDNTVVKSGDEGEAGAEKTKSSGSMKKLIMFGGIGLGVLVLGVALALFVLKPMMSGSGAGEADAIEQVTDAESDHKPARKVQEKKKAHKPRKKSSGHGKESGDAGLIYAIKDIVVNPAGTGGTRFLSVSFGFELESGYLAAEFEEREMMVRDALITILSAKTVAQLTDPKQKEIVRYQVKKRLEALLETDELAGVYFTDFVLQ